MRAGKTLRQEPRIRTDPTVAEGGVIVVHVAAGVDEVCFKPAGHPPTKVPVVDGRAEYRVPPSVRGGSTVYISDLKFPDPASAEVQVTGGQGT